MLPWHRKQYEAQEQARQSAEIAKKNPEQARFRKDMLAWALEQRAKDVQNVNAPSPDTVSSITVLNSSMLQPIAAVSSLKKSCLDLSSLVISTPCAAVNAQKSTALPRSVKYTELSDGSWLVRQQYHVLHSYSRIKK